jgi:Phosphoinositide phospholipase C, Ca2+-dependent
MKPAALVLLALVSASAQQVKINEIQLVGTHNSYHSGISPNEMANLRKLNPRAADSLEYRHPSLETQLNDGVRQLEIDVYGDAKGGLFAHPQGPILAAKAGLPADPPFDVNGIMMKPGFKVLHVQDIDYRSNCEPFTNCLEIVRAWSKAHRGHLPIFVLVENKDGKPALEGGAVPEPLTPETFDALDAEIRSVFQPGEIITPDDVRGKHKTLNVAILEDGWPTLDKARGKVIFLLDQRRVGAIYTIGHPSLEGRVLFTNAAPGTPDAAFTECNDSVKDPELVPGLIRKGYLVRTMTDPGFAGVKANETARRDASIKSGAQILSTDYPAGEPAESGFFVTVRPAGQTYPNARCNPVLKPAQCTDAMLKENK